MDLQFGNRCVKGKFHALRSLELVERMTISSARVTERLNDWWWVGISIFYNHSQFHQDESISPVIQCIKSQNRSIHLMTPALFSPSRFCIPRTRPNEPAIDATLRIHALLLWTYYVYPLSIAEPILNGVIIVPEVRPTTCLATCPPIRLQICIPLYLIGARNGLSSAMDPIILGHQLSFISPAYQHWTLFALPELVDRGLVCPATCRQPGDERRVSKNGITVTRAYIFRRIFILRPLPIHHNVYYCHFFFTFISHASCMRDRS